MARGRRRIVGRRLFAVRSPDRRAAATVPAAATAESRRTRQHLTPTNDFGNFAGRVFAAVPVVLEAAVVRDQVASGHVAVASARGRGKQRRPVGRGARPKVRIHQRDRQQGLLRTAGHRFQRIPKRSYGHVG